jgi:hypothetical protein
MKALSSTRDVGILSVVRSTKLAKHSHMLRGHNRQDVVECVSGDSNGLRWVTIEARFAGLAGKPKSGGQGAARSST